MLRPVMVKLMAVVFPATVPSNAPSVPVVIGPVKSSWSALIQVPVARLVASVLYWKSSLSALAVAPSLHCSPT